MGATPGDLRCFFFFFNTFCALFAFLLRGLFLAYEVRSNVVEDLGGWGKVSFFK